MYSVQLGACGGGVNDFLTPDMIGDNESQPSSRNSRSEGNAFRFRKGYTAFADLLTGSSSGVRALGVYTRNNDADDRLLAVYNNTIYDIEPDTETTWSSIYSGVLLTNSTNVDIVSYGDWAFLFNGVDKPLRLENTTVTADFTPPDALTAAEFLPSFGEAYLETLWVAGVPGVPNVVFVSQIATVVNPEYIYDFSGESTQNAWSIPFPDRVTAIRKLSNALVIFTVTEAYYVSGFDINGDSWTINPIGGSRGCIAQKACTVVENDIYYVTPQKEIRSVKRGFSDILSVLVTPLSKNVQNFLKNECSNDISNTFSYYDPINKYYKVYFTATDGSRNTLRLVANINNIDPNTNIPPFDIDDSVPFQCGVAYRQKTYVGSTVLGQVYVDENGLADDSAANIVGKRVTKECTANNPTTYKKFRGIRVLGEITIASTVYLDIYVDGILSTTETISLADLVTGSSVYEGGIGVVPIGDTGIGTEEEGESPLDTRYDVLKRVSLRVSGRRMRIEFRVDGNMNDVKFRHIEYDFIPRGPLFNPIIEK